MQATVGRYNVRQAGLWVSPPQHENTITGPKELPNNLNSFYFERMPRHFYWKIEFIVLVYCHGLLSVVNPFGGFLTSRRYS